MRKSFIIKDLDCANCAARMENEINKLDDRVKAKVSYMTQRLVLDAPDDIFDEILEKSRKAVKKVDSACEIVPAK